MSTVRLKGVYFSAYPGDHEPRHVHGEYGETVAIINLRPDGVVVLANRVDQILPGNAKRSDVRKTKIRNSTEDAAIDAAIARAKLYDRYRPKAIAAKYFAKNDVFAIKLASGVEILVPRKLLQGLENATSAQLSDVRIVGAKSGLRWDSLDVDHYVPSLVEGIFGNRRWMGAIGKKGGSVRSAAKTRAVRANGQKGGRPKGVSALREH